MSAYLVQIFKSQFTQFIFNINYKKSIMTLFKADDQLKLFLLLEMVVLMMLFYFLTSSQEKLSVTETIKVTDNIEIPKPVGQGQHGTSRFMTEEEKEKVFSQVIHKPDTPVKEKKNLGLVIGMSKESKEEIISCVEEDEHSIILGATRSGKTRGQILQTIWLRAMTGKSMVMTDVKGELFLYTKPYLVSKGYKVIDFDLREPKKSRHYNYMSDINRAVDEKDIPRAIEYTWDLVSVLVGTPKGEPLWTNGESATIAAGILALAIEAPKAYRNLTNVYYFLLNMCKEDEFGEMKITKYFEDLPDSHPAKGVFGVAEISPEKMRGSFFGSALATLRLFTDWNIAAMTKDTDFSVQDIGKEKIALFIVIPDEKKARYPLVSLFVNQAYVNLVELANQYGGRVPNEVDFLLDEFGNFPTIPNFGSILSAGASRGLRFTLVLQDYQQLEKKYKDDFENIKGNCVNTVYLQTPTPNTLEELSKRTGTYTCQVNSANNSISGTRANYSRNISFSDSANMQSRPLLKPDEIGRLKRPYVLVLKTGEFPSIFKAPDLSQYAANKELGLGSKEDNKKIYMERNLQRKERHTDELELWGIWNNYKKNSNNSVKEERVSFLK